jgi:hypothetical protein
MIPPPKLDDRNYYDIVAEAISMIPRYAPEWTNHNPSDPGITIIELAAWMTDILIYRLNQVPDRNYVAFLNLLGIKLRPPRSARALVQFTLVEGASKQKLPIATQVSTAQASEEPAVMFETQREVVIAPAVLDRCFSYYDDSYSENSHLINPVTAAAAADVFAGAQRVDRFLYLTDPRFANAGESSVLRIFLGAPERGNRDMARLLEWEYWNGQRWRELTPAVMEVDRGEVAFAGPLQFEPTTVHHVEGLWVRGRLAEVPDSPDDTELDIIRARVEVSGDGLVPTKAFANLDNSAFLPLDLSKNVYPFGKEPKHDCMLYVACDELMRTADAYISIEFLLADGTVIPRPNPAESLILAFEYWDSKRWRHIGRSSPRGGLPGAGDDVGFNDDTRGFSQSGSVSFRRPKDMDAVDVNGEIHRWIRVRIEKGDYGEQGTYTLENDRWLFKDDRPLRPPAMRNINFRYREDYREVKTVITFNDFEYKDVSDVARTEYTIFQPFSAKVDESPALYLGYISQLPSDTIAVYFQTDEELGLGSVPSEEAEIATSDLQKYESMRKSSWESEQRVIWEFWNGRVWDALTVEDETLGFSSSGFLFFVPPQDWLLSSKFNEDRYWLRARLEMGGYVKPPRLRRILTNCIDAYSHETIRDEILGSSDGSPLQTYKLLRSPVLEDEQITVRERQSPLPEEVADLASNAVARIEPENPQSVECWVTYRRVESFFASQAKSRHYVLDYGTGEVKFGDGRRGFVPPEGRNSIVAKSYRIGGGSNGNVNAGTLTSLGRSLAYVESVTNPLPASAGADRETIEEAKNRAPYTIKSRDRAVTAEDYEMLALRASTTLARAKCVPDRTNRGHVTVALIPKGEVRGEELTRRLLPSNEVLRFVRRYLDERKLVGSVLSVVKPRYKDISMRVVLIRRTVGTSDRLRKEIELKLRRFLHSLVGGKDGKGWEFGRPVLKAELMHSVEEVPGVEGVDQLEIRDEARNVAIEHVRLDDDELPFLVNLTVSEKVRDDIR